MSVAIQIRDAMIDDARVVWEINAHPSVRAQSISTDDISWEDHQRWYHEQVVRDDVILKVVLLDHVVVGVVRFVLCGKSQEAIISTALAPEARGLGIGRRMLEQASQELLQACRCQRVVALIRPSNTASLKAFEAAGFRFSTATQEGGVELLQYHLEMSHAS